MSTQPCAICDPQRVSRALCNCCKQYLCLNHLKEHDDLLNSQLEPIADNINQLADRFKQYNAPIVLQSVHAQLEHWKDTAYQSIKQIYKQKFNEINQIFAKKLDNLKQQLENTRTTVSKLIQKQNVTNEQISSLHEEIRNIQNNMKLMEDKPIDLIFHPVVIDENSIQFQSDDDINNNSQLVLGPILKTINPFNDDSVRISTNQTNILLYGNETLCLYDLSLNLIEKIRLKPEEPVADMCWSATLDRFIVISNDNIFLFNQTNMSIEHSNIPTRRKGHWHNVTCSSNCLYLTANEWGTSIYEFNIHSSLFLLHRRLEIPLTCNKNERIDHFVHIDKKDYFAMIITSQTSPMKQFKLKDVRKLQTIWSTKLDFLQFHIHRNRFCCIGRNHWLIIDSNKSKFLYYFDNGTPKQVIDYKQSQILLAVQVKSNLLAVVTQTSINLHEFSQ